MNKALGNRLCISELYTTMISGPVPLPLYEPNCKLYQMSVGFLSDFEGCEVSLFDKG